MIDIDKAFMDDKPYEFWEMLLQYTPVGAVPHMFQENFEWQVRRVLSEMLHIDPPSVFTHREMVDRWKGNELRCCVGIWEKFKRDELEQFWKSLEEFDEDGFR